MQKQQLDKIQSLVAKLSPLSAKVALLPERLAAMRARAALAVWLHRTNSMASVKRKVERLAYDAGVVSENIFRILCAFDDIHGDDEIRALRKEKVLQIKDEMSKADDSRARALKLAKFVEAKVVPTSDAEASDSQSSHSETELVEPQPMEDQQQEPQPMEGQQQQAQPMEDQHQGDDDHDDEEEEEEEEEEEDEEEEEEKQEEQEEEKEGEEEESDGEEEDRGSDVRQRLPRWRPKTQQRRLAGGVELLFQLPNVDSRSLEIKLDERRLSVSGVKKPVYDFFGRPTAYGWFVESFDISKEFDLDRATQEFIGGVLSIKLPYAARRRPARRAPPSYGYSRPCSYGYPSFGQMHHRPTMSFF